MRPRPRAFAAVVVLCLAGFPRSSQSAPGDSTSTSLNSNPAAQAMMPPPASTPPDFPRGRISGLVFADAYYNVDGISTHTYNSSGADQGSALIDGTHPITQDLNGIFLRRVYFQLDNDLTVRFATRFRLEVDSRSLTADGKITPFVKNAYVLAKSAIPRGDFYFGMLNTPAFENIEDFWQYRSIEKTLGDFRGLQPAADLGAELKGWMDSDHRVGYSAMIGNGAGQRPEGDRFKRFYVNVPIHVGDLRVEPYADFQAMRVNLGPKVPAHTDSLEANQDGATFRIFAGYEFRRFALGGEAISRETSHLNASKTEQRGYSIFGRSMIHPKFGVVVRFDQWQSDANNPNRVDSQLWIAGVDWVPTPDLRVQPNLEIVRYDKVGNPAAASVPGQNDFQARITFYYRFSKPQS